MIVPGIPSHLFLRLAVLCLLAATLPALLSTPSSAAPSTASLSLTAGDHVLALPLRGVINPVTAGYIARCIDQAEQEQAAALIIEMDTPGGLMESMRDISQRILAARVPVVVYVSPPGARAASAGVFITMASHVAAMAPHTNIGAAHPVGLGQGDSDKASLDKATNDAVASIRSTAALRGRNPDWAERAVRDSISATEQEAKDAGVVEIIASDMPDLLRQLDGRPVSLATGPATLRTNGVTIRRLEMTFIEDFLLTISNPNIALILMMLGTYGLIYELASPGQILPGVVGGIAILLGLYSLGTLPSNYAALGLIVFAMLLFAAEVFVTSHGVLAVGGLVALILGSMMLVNAPAPYMAVAWPVMAGIVLVTGGFMYIVVNGVVRSRRRPVVTGVEALPHAIAVARTDLQPEGFVYLQGELWSAIADDGDIPKGTRVEVVDRENLKLRVRRA
jgi:membrane-bound serine protease (ClpP class)